MKINFWYREFLPHILNNSLSTCFLCGICYYIFFYVDWEERFNRRLTIRTIIIYVMLFFLYYFNIQSFHDSAAVNVKQIIFEDYTKYTIIFKNNYG